MGHSVISGNFKDRVYFQVAQMSPCAVSCTCMRCYRRRKHRALIRDRIVSPGVAGIFRDKYLLHEHSSTLHWLPSNGYFFVLNHHCSEHKNLFSAGARQSRRKSPHFLAQTFAPGRTFVALKSERVSAKAVIGAE
jgi:hypothetical protein